MTLAPARYRPWLKGVYDVSPGLRPLGTDFGNGSLDSDLFQLDGDLARYQLNKAEAIGERKSKYVQEHKLSASVRESVLSLIRTHLKQDFSSLEDAAMRVAEDFAIVSTDRGRDWVSFLHLCSPSHWAAEERIGKSFFDIHRAVPEFERVNAVSTSLVQSMIRRGPFVRFVWGIESDDRLNHHPEPPPQWSPDEWHGRSFETGRFWVRTERQVMWGLPEVDAALFTIRVGFHEDSEILSRPELKDPLLSALHSMSPEIRAYKGLDREWSRLMAILAS